MASSPVIGIDLGGTKIEGLYIVPSAPDKAVCRIRVPAEGEKGYRHRVALRKDLCGNRATTSAENWNRDAGLN
jgi:hypothetical protein